VNPTIMMANVMPNGKGMIVMMLSSLHEPCAILARSFQAASGHPTSFIVGSGQKSAPPCEPHISCSAYETSIEVVINIDNLAEVSVL
jgi:hypothetical protein